MKRRGQTLVLFSVTMLAMVVMVGVSLTIGMRVREKIELQTLSDAAAYSNAIATARAYNQIALWNRAQVAHMVTLAGVQSHISYASWYVGLLKGTQWGTNIAATAALAFCIKFKYKPCCTTARVGYRMARAFGREYNSESRTMRDMDEDMGKAARAVQTAASAYGSAGKRLYESQRFRALRGKLPERVLELGTKQVHNAGEYSVTNSSKVLSERELAQASADSGQVPSLGMANGSRKSAFIRERGGIGAKPPHPPILATQFNSVVAFNPDGTGHFGRSKHVPVETGNNQAWADDEGYSVGTINSASACPWPTGGTASAYVKSSAKEFPSYHRFSPGDKHKGNRDEMHDLASCKDAQGNPCNSVWVGRQEFNINNSDAQQLRPDASGQAAAGGAPEQWRQPKSVVGIERDYSARSRRDPWEFQFNLSVSNGSTTELDLKKDRFGGARDTQRTLSTGITYYHRHMSNAGQSWLEPPNLYNPYWRATLVPADIDGDRDLTVVGRDLILRLKQSGFKGVQ